MARKALTAAIIIAILLPAILKVEPALAQSATPAPLTTCDSNMGVADIGAFLLRVGTTWAALAGADTLANFLAGISPEVKPSIFGFSLGGATFQDIFGTVKETTNFLYSYWLRALFWGVLGTLIAAVSGQLLQGALDLNAHLFTNNTVVQIGYGTILGLVNTAFVIGLILMAFATMLRRSGWDAQSILARFIIAILLINFSLFFAGIVLGVGTSLTQGFLNGSGCPSQELYKKFNIVTVYDDVTSSIAKSIQNQGTAQAPDAVKAAGLFTGGFKPAEILSKITDTVTSWISWLAANFVADIVGMFFAAALTIIGGLTMFGLFLFLIARYVAVTILLVFMPIAWLGLAFPKLSVPGLGNAWSGWWQQFLRWVFYGPIIAFFLFLTVKLIGAIPSVSGSFVNDILQMFIIILFSLGGLWAANKLSITGAAMVYGAANKGWAKGLAAFKTRGINVATAPLRTQTGKKLTASLQATPGFKAVGRALNTAGAKGEKVDEDKFKDLSSDRLAQMIPALSSSTAAPGELVAALAKLGKSGDITKVPNIGRYMNARTKRLFESYGKGFGDIEKGAGINIAAWEALNNGDKVKAEQEMKTFYSGLSAKDMAKLPVNNIYGNKPYLGLSNENYKDFVAMSTRSILQDPGNLNKIGPKLNSKNFETFFTAVAKEALPEITEAQLKDHKTVIDMLKKDRPDIHKAFSKTLAAHETGVGFTPEPDEEKAA